MVTKMPSDAENLDVICEAFTKALLANPMQDMKSYMELAHRMAALMDCEIRWKLSKEEEKILMQAWGALNN